MTRNWKMTVLGLAMTAMCSTSVMATPYSDAVLADNPFVYYGFEEAPGATVAIDLTGNGNDGTYVGTTLGGTEAGAPVGLGNAGSFGNANSWVDVPALGGNHSQLTLETWINIDGIAGGCCTSIFSTDSFGSNA